MDDRQLRVALITPGFSASEDDWCIPAVLNLVRELSQAHDVHVFTLRYPYRRDTYDVYGATVHAFGGATVGGLRRLPLLIRAATRIVREARRRPFDVVHGFWADEPGVLAVAVGRLLGVPGIVSLLGGELVGFDDIGYGGQLSQINRRLTSLSLRWAERVTVGSETLQAVAARYVDSARLVTLPLGVDTMMFRPASKPNEDKVRRLVHVASLTSVKEQGVLLRAFADVVRRIPNVELVLVGGGPLRRRLERQASRLGIIEHVRLLGPISHDNLPSVYQRADLFVLSSRYESQNVAVLEAAACGVPAVGTAVGILPELNSWCVTVPVGDTTALGAAIVDVLSDDARRDRMGRAARRQIEREHALGSTVSALARLYRELIAGDSVDLPLTV